MNGSNLISNSGLHDYRVISLRIDNDTSIIESTLADLHYNRIT